MGEIIINGALGGLILSVMAGPAFFLLIETSIRRGFRAGLAFDLGVITNDLVYISLAYFFYSQVSALQSSKEIISVIGGTLFLGFGLYIMFSKKEPESKKLAPSSFDARDYAKLFAKGFLLNGINPGVIFYWFSIITLGSSKFEYSDQELVIWILVMLASLLCIDLLKIYGAKHLKSLLKGRTLLLINRVTALIILGFGTVLLVHGLWQLV